MNVAIILAGGIGSRMNLKDFPKQYLNVGGTPIIGYCLNTFQQHEEIDSIYIVADKTWEDFLGKWMSQNQINKFGGFVTPGESRQLSIYNALLAVEKEFQPEDNIIIHDAARPFVTKELLTVGLRELGSSEGVMPVLPAKDTFYQSDDRKVISALLPREKLFAGQAPEFFKLGKYVEIHKKMSKDEILKINGSSEIAYKSGLKVSLIAGEERNFKVTTPGDIELMKTFLGL